MEQSREKFASRLGFILISAGCAIGLGNVYRFPIITGAYGGGVFVLIYIAFLVLLGLPIMSAELAVGRGSQRSIASSFDVLEKKGQKWHLMKYLGICGNYLLMMFYTVISGWMVIYFVKYLTGSIMSASGVEGLSAVFGSMVSNPGLMVVSAFAVILICFGICSMGLQKGVEGITKWMMVALLALMIGLAVYSATLPNAAEGLRFYLVPSLKRLGRSGREYGDLCGDGAVLLYLEPRHWLDCDLRQLYRQGTPSTGRIRHHRVSGYLCGDHVRHDHLPGLLYL